MRLVLVLILFPLLSFAQHKSVSYELVNEDGTFKLLSFTFNHDLDNTEGVTYVLSKHDGHFDTVYQIDQFLNGWVALSNDGNTVAHLVSEKDKEALDQCVLTMFREGKIFDSARLDRLVNYELKSAIARDRLPENGWLRKDSLYHLMAENPFYITDDKLFLAFDNPKLAVFDMNAMFHIFTGNGANHFLQNYYSIPNPPLRNYMDGDAFFHEGFPATRKEVSVVELVSKGLGKQSAIPEEANLRAELTIKLESDGHFEVRNASIFSIKDNQPSKELSKSFKELIEKTEFDTSLIPPKHPAWIFETILWLK
ncbi:MAG: hypothetical protein H6603_07465 [Flavobacteriales bacterium]|nr:hypothetical protein [Flavobacteriales bacterium]MCB9190964.1 hypothetical protein [Flavobacteriales bacterium]MCB9204801.1 hypothetical protein [Flavobacteriales bacterium]